jgi:hypothetical protein
VNCDTAIFAWCTWKHLSVPQANGQAIVKGLANGQAIEERIS